MKPTVFCQPLSKFGMFTFLFYIQSISLSILFLMGEQTRFLDFLWDNSKEGGNFRRGR